ncbi:SCO6745 family protein [Nocardioides sp. SYSU DS0651]|uniref:SCO6745 family protein n=1 Tax=Nocardioides sp. SYSU DS0651 TaxID=3415955 RepID=UPI003F4C60FB
MEPHPARRLWSLVEPVHAVTYFAPEPLAALKEAGFRGFWMGYFAGRAAPLGAVGPEVIHALFYNFSPERVARALPAAWSFAAPEAALDARLRGSVAAVERAVGTSVDPDAVGRAAELLWAAAASAPLEGRALFAANRALPPPAAPVARLWHAATLLREHRGDGHVAALLAAGIGGRESHVLHATAAGVPRPVYDVARDFTDEEWSACRARLVERGLLADDGALTDAGTEVKAAVEARTDELAAPALAALSPAELAELEALLRPITAAVVRAGDIPLDSPMGLDLRSVAGERDG